MDADLIKTILTAAELAFGEAKTDIADCAPVSYDSWDSLSFLSFVMALEEKLNVSFEPEDIAEMAEGGYTLLGVVKRYKR